MTVAEGKTNDEVVRKKPASLRASQASRSGRGLCSSAVP